MKHPKEELTFLMIKPDGVQRGLTGEIIERIERTGLKIVGLKMFKPTKSHVDNHYPKDKAWIERLGQKTQATYEKYRKDMKKELGTRDTFKVGKMVRSWLIDFMTSGPIIAMAIKGVHAVDMVRKLAGETMPYKAELGTIRGDFSIDSPISANSDKRPVYNIVHASETQKEAKHEFKHWFGKKEPIWDYERSDEMIMFPKK
jgi:nucleoside-diphosphate kinase